MSDRENTIINDTKLDTCGCWERKESSNDHHNRPGLPAIDYRIDTHSTFLRRMLSRLSPRLSSLTIRSPDDPAIAILDAWATAADVLTFYQERIANEGYLRTAIERRSVLEMARAIGYELSPGVAASVYLAFTLEDALGAPGRAMIEERLKVMSIPGQDEKPQTFETVEKIEGRKEWNSLKPRLTVQQELTWGATELYLAGINTHLLPGDAILLVGMEREKNFASERWDFRILKTVTAFSEKEKNYTIVTWETGLGHYKPPVNPSDKPRVFTFRQRAALFGYNAPDWRAMPDAVKQAYYPIYDPEKPDEESIEYCRYKVNEFGKKFVEWGLDQNGKKILQGTHFAKIHWKKKDYIAMNGKVSKLVKLVKEQTFSDVMILDTKNNQWDMGDGWLLELQSADSNGALLVLTKDGVSQSQKVVAKGDVYTYVEKSIADETDVPMFVTYLHNVTAGEAQLKYTWLISTRIEYVPVEWPDFEIRTVNKNIIDLDAVYPKILTSSWVALQKPGYTELYKAKSVEAGSRSDFAVSAKTTHIELDTRKHLSWFGLRNTVVFAQSEELEMAKMPLTRTLDGKDIVLDGLVMGLDRERKIIVSGKRMCARIADEMNGLLLVPSSDLIKPVKLKAGEILRIIELPAIDGNGIRWHLMNRDGFDGTLNIVPNGKLIITLDGKAQINADDISIVTDDGKIKKLQRNEIFIFQKPPFSVALGRLEWHITNDTDVKGIVSIESEKIIPVHSSKDDETTGEAAFIEYATSDLERTAITLKESLSNIYDRTTVSIYANVALATHGETVYDEKLGNGDGTRANQRFKLNKVPLTYISAPTPRGILSTIKVHVNGVEWKETQSLFDLGANSQNYILRIDNDGKTYVTFGDGKKGARLPSGQENIVATYRSGIGQEGEVGANKLSLLQKRPLGVREVTNPIAASGAAPPENLENARTNAPFTVLTLERIVSLRDFEDFTRAFSGIGKSQAVTFWMGEKKIVHITVAASGGKPVDPKSNLYINLCKGIDAVRLPVQHVIVESYKPYFFNLEARVKIDTRYISDKILASIKTALERTFSFENRSFGQAVTASEITTVIQDVEGVIYIDIEKLYKSTESPGLSQILPASRAFLDDKANFKPAELLLIKPGGITLTVILNE